MTVQVRDNRTGKMLPDMPKQAYQRLKQFHPEWELINEDIREPLKPKPIDEVQAKIAEIKSKTHECCKDKELTPFIELCYKVEEMGLVEQAAPLIEALLFGKSGCTEPEYKEKIKDPAPITKPVETKKAGRKPGLKVKVKK